MMTSISLAPEWLNLSAGGLIFPIQSARPSSTRSFYDCKWKVFEEWCSCNNHIPFGGGDFVILVGPN